MQRRTRVVVLVGVLEIVLLLGGCKKKVVASAPPPPPPPAPTVMLTPDPSTIERGQPVTLSWTSANATDVDLEPGREEYNLGLGDKRATSAKHFLVNLGVAADRISTIS